MTRRERLMKTLAGKPVDRPAVSFYEINGLEDTANQDPFNIYADPSWKPLINLAAEKTDRIVMRSVGIKDMIKGEVDDLTSSETWYDEGGSRFTKTTIKLPGKTLTQTTRRDPDVKTVWTIEHLLKDVDDFKAWLEIPNDDSIKAIDIKPVIDTEKRLSDTGIVMLDTPDPLCKIAPLFSMEEYTITGFSESKLMHKALEKVSHGIYNHIESVCKALPGHLWRIYGPEYASPPYLPPHLFKEYVADYVKPMVDIIHKYDGYARIHSHGNLKDILDYIVATGCDGLDPIEPPNQGDVELSYVREKYGEQLVLFGNLEITDIENMETANFAKKVHQAIEEGTAGNGRGFVLMPSACPYGRHLSDLTMQNYEKMIKIIEERWEI
jgi:uroporphyrinogen decarboxylase-like protein